MFLGTNVIGLRDFLNHLRHPLIVRVKVFVIRCLGYVISLARNDVLFVTPLSLLILFINEAIGQSLLNDLGLSINRSPLLMDVAQCLRKALVTEG